MSDEVKKPEGEEPKAEETKAEEIKAEESKAEATEAEESKAEATKAEVTKAEPLAKESIADEAKVEADRNETAPPAKVEAQDEDAEKAAKRKAAEEARAARAAARAKAAGGGEDGEEKPKEPSPNQPKLDQLVQLIREHVGEAAVVEAYMNERDRHLPCVVIDGRHWTETAKLMRDHESLKLHYLRNVSGVDQETHMEVVYYLINMQDKQDYCVKVKTDRDNPEIPSITPIWATANWNEREIYDLLGITFSGHPNLCRIMMPDDWAGHPLRKDYEPIDPEV